MKIVNESKDEISKGNRKLSRNPEFIKQVNTLKSFIDFLKTKDVIDIVFDVVVKDVSNDGLFSSGTSQVLGVSSMIRPCMTPMSHTYSDNTKIIKSNNFYLIDRIFNINNTLSPKTSERILKIYKVYKRSLILKRI